MGLNLIDERNNVIGHLLQSLHLQSLHLQLDGHVLTDSYTYFETSRTYSAYKH